MSYTNKYYASGFDVDYAISEVTKACDHYVENCFKWRDDVTGRQAKDEFWKIMAEYYGFKIDFQRELAFEPKPDGEER